jgi:hypothetical protein
MSNCVCSENWEVWEDEEELDCVHCNREICDGCELLKELDDESIMNREIDKLKA